MASKTSSRLTSIPLPVGLALSAFMIFVSVFTFTGIPALNGPDLPVLTTIRDPRSGLLIIHHRALQLNRWLYQGAKGAGAILWCILIPLQHSAAVRRRWPQLHRASGWTVVLLSVELGLIGHYMHLSGMITSHEKWYHVHAFAGVPPFIWPTFMFDLFILGFFYFLSLYKLVATIKAGNVASHSRWASFHSMTGYAISIERLAAVAVLLVGWTLQRLPRHVQRDWLRLPLDPEGKFAVEVGALAWTLAVAGMVIAGWSYRTFGHLAPWSGQNKVVEVVVGEDGEKKSQ